MELETIQKIESSVETLRSKKSRVYFLVQDTKGNPKSSVRHIYDIALTLFNNGFNPTIIHETNDYKGVSEWLGDQYEVLPHQSIDGQNLAISPEDFIIIPEIYAHVMEQIKNFPCAKIVLCQAYDHMLETLPPGVSWSQYGFTKCITTSEFQKKYISEIMRSGSFDVLLPNIPSVFTKKDKPSKPIISIHTRDPRDTAKVIKSFYLKYPQFRWITFRDMRGIKQDDFAKFLSESFVSVWVDLESGFGTFPIESMICGTPVIGKIPNLKPEWMGESNGLWVNQTNELIDVIANFTQNWLEDNIADTLYENMSVTGKEYQDEEIFKNSVLNLFNEYFETRRQTFEEQLEKIKESVEKN
jgi:hypothetical protein